MLLPSPKFLGTPVTPATPANVVQSLPDPWVSQITNTDTLAAVAQILQSPQGQQVKANVHVWLKKIHLELHTNAASLLYINYVVYR